PLLPLSSAFDQRRNAYVDHLLDVSRNGNWTAWLRFFLESVIMGADEALGLITALDDLRTSMHLEVQSARSSALLMELVDSLFERPATTIGAATALLGVTAASASANISKLVQAGILKEITGRTRDRIYIAHRILDVMSDRSASAARTDAIR
ncbi:MAG: Fic family protein, partial [Gemmatimonas sp.]